MKTVTIRQVRHDLKTVLEWVEQGEQVTILNRARPVARICPLEPEPATVKEMPDFAARIKKIFGDKVIPNAVVEERDSHRW